MIIAVTGMAREARLIAQAGVLSVVGGGDIDALEKRIDAAVARGGRRVLSIGICGALCPELKVGDVVIASEIVTPDAVYTTNASWTRELAARIPHAFVAPMAGINSVSGDPANKADLQAVRKAMEDVKAAIAAGKTAAEVQAILDAVKPAIDRLATARKTLHDQLESVLTPEQKASGCIPLG